MTLFRRQYAFILIAALCTSPVAESQAAEPETPATILRSTAESWMPDDKVRITLHGVDDVSIAGRFQSIDSDSLLRLSPSWEEHDVVIPARQIRVIEEWNGHSRHPLEGAVVGVFLGAVIGAAIGSGSSETTGQPMFGNIMPFIGATAGAIVGTGIGFAITSDKWEIVATIR